tara:strand:+ start:930 stop:1103 length:174 start_codon:yes stop_codon:yes gene_type:complete
LFHFTNIVANILLAFLYITKGDVRMAKKKPVKIDPNKVKKEDLQNVFSKVLSKLKNN